MHDPKQQQQPLGKAAIVCIVSGGSRMQKLALPQRLIGNLSVATNFCWMQIFDCSSGVSLKSVLMKTDGGYWIVALKRGR